MYALVERAEISVETIQCVKGAVKLDIGSATTFTTYDYCGSTLRISRGSSGHLVAALEGIRSDTQVIASKVALDNVQDSLQSVVQARESLAQDIQKEYTRKRLRLELVWILSIMLGLIVGFIIAIRSYMPIFGLWILLIFALWPVFPAWINRP